MPNYFYTDASGQKRGPVNNTQLQALAARGVITPDTQLETEGGHTGTAKQVSGLNFNTVSVPPPYAQVTPQMPDERYTQSSGNLAGSVVSWLFDFAFRDLRLPVINLWACRILYVICCIAAILWGIGTTFMLFSIAFSTYARHCMS